MSNYAVNVLMLFKVETTLFVGTYYVCIQDDLFIFSCFLG